MAFSDASLYDVVKSRHTNCCAHFPRSRRRSKTGGERIWKEPKTGKKDVSLSHTLLHLLGGGDGQQGEAGPLLLKESCHFDSHHQGDGCAGPQSSALLDGGGGVCAAPSSTPANLHQTRRSGPRSVVTANCHGDGVDKRSHVPCFWNEERS